MKESEMNYMLKELFSLPDIKIQLPKNLLSKYKLPEIAFNEDDFMLNFEPDEIPVLL